MKKFLISWGAVLFCVALIAFCGAVLCAPKHSGGFITDTTNVLYGPQTYIGILNGVETKWGLRIWHMEGGKQFWERDKRDYKIGALYEIKFGYIQWVSDFTGLNAGTSEETIMEAVILEGNKP